MHLLRVSARVDTLPALAPLAAAQGQLHAVDGSLTGGRLGCSLVRFHVLDGDGRADVLAGAPDHEFFPFGQDKGMFRCFSGQTGEPPGHRTGQNDEHLGEAFASADTWDSKPGWEFLVGSPQSELGGADSGRVASFSIFPNTPTTCCTAKVNSQGCTPVISGSGQPSVAPGVAFSVKTASVLNSTPGILLYALDAAASPFQGGFPCVGAPFRAPRVCSPAAAPSAPTARASRAWSSPR